MPQRFLIVRRALQITILLLRTLAPAKLAAQQVDGSAVRSHGLTPYAAHLEIKYVRDSMEYSTLTRQIYSLAATVLPTDRKAWAVVMDIDQTVLDGSVYQLERAAYDLPFDEASWRAWVSRGSAPAVPGSVEFTRKVHSRNGLIVWLTDRQDAYRDVTKQNLKALGLWADQDLFCPSYGETNKKSRRRELQSNSGTCSSPKIKTVVAFIGDQMGDFPEAGEHFFDGPVDDQFGKTNFLLPNPMYGKWAVRVTRTQQ